MQDDDRDSPERGSYHSSIKTGDTGGSDAADRNAARRDARSRAHRLRQLFSSLEIEHPLAEQIIADLSSLLPPQHRMSRAEDVKSRLSALLQRDRKSPAPIALGHSGVELDVESDGTVRSQDKLDDLLAEGDERLLQAYAANERLRGVLATQVAEHEAMRDALVGELARRYTVLEQWRYKLPKAFMPVIAVLLKAKVKRDDLRLGKTLLGDIIDLVAAHSKRSEITPEALAETARHAEEQFASLVDDHRENEQECESGKRFLEPFEVAEKRLKPRHQELATEWRRCRTQEAEAELRPFSWLVTASGGLDEFGRPVFKDAKDFEAAVRYLVEHNRAEFSS